jgi:hypothetical protein
LGMIRAGGLSLAALPPHMAVSLRLTVPQPQMK